MGGGILQRIASGDATGASACLAEYGDMVWALAKRYLSASPSEIEDAVQDVFVEIWRHAARYDAARGSEAAFVATIAHRRLIDRQRQLSSVAAAKTRETQRLEVKPLPLDVPGTRDDLRAVAVAFDHLEIEEKNVLWFALYHGMSHEQIARATDQPLGTVKTRIRRGIGRLREILGQKRAAAEVRSTP